MKRFFGKNAKRVLLATFIVLFSMLSFAATYYVSNTGNDSNSGLTAALAWKTLTKVNAATFVAGDQILFQKGDTFYGSFTIKQSGTVANPITFGAYGTGANPIITGFTSVTEWTNLGGNIWESTNSVSTLSDCNMVTINGVNTAMGRYPNTGYLTYQSYSTNTSITSNSLSGTPNWTGAEVVIRKERWIINRYPITSQSGGTLTYSGGGYYVGKNNYGFFIQNDLRTLDQQNEWYYNPTTKKIQVYSTSIPTDVKVATINTLITMLYRSYIMFEGISFNGANLSAINIGSCRNASITNCSIDFCYNGIYGQDYGQSSVNFVFQNSIINHINNNAIRLSYEFYKSNITNNVIKNTGIIVGLGGSSDEKSSAIISKGTKSTIQYNKIDSVGYHGIGLFADSATVNNNFVNYSCLVKDDGGGLYFLTSTGSIVSENIVTNTWGNANGTNVTSSSAQGIYFDGGAHDAQLLNNSVANVGNIGILLNNSKNMTIRSNTIYNASISFMIRSDETNTRITNIGVDNNIFIARTANQMVYKAISVHDDIPNFGTFDNNYYARPIDDNQVFVTNPYGQTETPGKFFNYSLSTWKTYSSQDANSNKSPQAITNVNDFQFEYNATTSAKTVALSQPMIDVKGTKYTTSITLQPFTSVVLIKDSNPAKYSTENISICNGTTYNGWTVSGEYERTLIAKSGSDSIVTTYLTVNPKYSVSEDVTINEGEAYNGWTESGKYTRNLTSVLGCDSIVATNLTVESLIIKQGSIPPTHFIPVWQGENGLNHMNIMVVSAILEDLPLSPEDEIAVFSGLICVGSMKLSETIIADDNSTYLTISASQDDGSGNGFTINDTIVFKIWDNKNQLEMIAKAVVYRNNSSTWLTSGKYAAGATSVVEIVSYTEYSQTIALKKGYNMISTFVTAQNPLASDVTQLLADAGYLIKLQDQAGNSLEDWGTFGGWVNNIGSIQDTEGYKIKVTENCSLQVTGRPIVLPLDIPLRSGWNIISFPRTDLVDAMNIIQPLIDQNKLIKVQDESGNSIEDWGIFGGWKNGIGYFIPGKAYKVKMTSDAALTIQENYLKSGLILANAEETEYFYTGVEGNGSEHMNINIVGLRDAGISAGDELAAFDGKVCVGTIKITENNMIDGSAALVASFSSDELAVDGFTEGHVIQIAAWNKLTGEESTVKTDVLTGQMSFTKNSSVLLKVNALTTDVKNFLDVVTIDVFPNPSQGKVTVRFSSVPIAGSSIDILDISGRKVASRNITGMSEVFNLDQQPAGVYLVKSKLGTNETIHKLVIN